MKPISKLGKRTRLLLAVVPLAVAQSLPPGRADGQEQPEEIIPNVFLLSGLGCNVVAALSPGGTLLIDNGRDRTVGSLHAQLDRLGATPVKIAIDTHFHFDHVGASEALGEAGAAIIGHDNTRTEMMTEWRVPELFGVRYPVVHPYPEAALPFVTLDETLTVHFDGEEVELIHYPNAHSDSDIAVFLRDRNLIHTGDLYLSNGFPILDSFHGGTIDGLLSALDGLIDLIDDETVVVPGHGPPSDRQGVQAYREMLAAGRDRIADLVSTGLTLGEVVEADPTAGLYEGGDSWLDPRLFVWSVFADLTGQGR